MLLNTWFDFTKSTLKFKNAIKKLKSDFNKLKLFTLNLRSKEFTILIEHLFNNMRILKLNDQLRTEYKTSEKIFL